MPEKSVMYVIIYQQNCYNYYLDYNFNPSNYYCILKTCDIYNFIVKKYIYII